jgi:hypothetical protein
MTLAFERGMMSWREALPPPRWMRVRVQTQLPVLVWQEAGLSSRTAWKLLQNEHGGRETENCDAPVLEGAFRDTLGSTATGSPLKVLGLRECDPDCCGPFWEEGMTGD